MKNTEIYPYLSKIVSLESLDDTYNVGYLKNGEKILIFNNYKVGDVVFCIPNKTVLSYEFLETYDYLDAYVNDYNEFIAFSYEGELFMNFAIPLDMMTYESDISLEYLNSLELDSNVEELDTSNSNKKYYFSQELIEKNINYEFIPIEEDGDKSNILSFESYSYDEMDSFSKEDVEAYNKKMYTDQVFLNPEQIEKLLEIRNLNDFETHKIGQRDWLISIFSNRTVEEADEKETRSYRKTFSTKVIPPLIPIEGYFKLPANTLPNQPNEILTTAGLYVFNMFVISAAFKDKIPYINHQMNAGNISKLNDDLASLLLQNKIQVKDELEIYWNNLTFISYLTEMLMPGCPVDFIEELKEVKKLKKELIEKYKDEIEKGDAAFYSDNIEKPLLELARNLLKDNPAWDIYALGKKPSFDNNYRTCYASVGPVYNFIKDSYEIITNSFDDGINKEKFSVYCNQLIYGTYNRAVKTSYGGAQSKILNSSLSNIKIGGAGTDCGTKKTLKMILSKSTHKDYLYAYIINPFYSGNTINNTKNINGIDTNSKYIELTPEAIQYFIDKEVELRTPLYCESEHYCNICFGNLYYRLGVSNAALTAQNSSRSIMTKSMKAFHDSSTKTIKINLADFLTEIK